MRFFSIKTICCKKLLTFSLFILFTINVKAQASGTGCRIGDNVYTQYLGNGPYYGNNNDMVSVYNVNGPKLVVINGQGYAGYQCGKINVYPAGKRYNPTTNTEDPYPGVNEVTGTISRNSCIASTHPSVSSGGKADIIQFQINNPTYCATQNVPLDDYVGIFALLSGATGAYFISRKVILA